jgi:hypothetical protein
MFTGMIKPLKHRETPFFKATFFFSIIIPAMEHYRHVFYSICDGRKIEFVNPLFALSLNEIFKSFKEINTI